MKIVNRKTFLSLPPKTVYCEYTPCIFGTLCIKLENCGTDDFYVQELNCPVESNNSEEWMQKLDYAERFSTNLLLDFDESNAGRDGYFVEEQLFAVWDQDDIKGLITRLQQCLNP